MSHKCTSNPTTGLPTAITSLWKATTVAALALGCTVGTSWGQSQLSVSTVKVVQSSQGGIDAPSCGGTLLTQNTDPDTVAAGTVSCNAGGVPTDNFYARNFVIAAPIFVKCVDFGVETSNAVGAWNIRVRLYTSPNAGTPVTANLTMIAGSEQQVSVPANSALSFHSATYPGAGIAVPAGNLVVELFCPCRQTTCTGPPAGDGGVIFLGSNAAGQSAPSYIKAADCGLTDYGDLAGIGFPNVHMVMRLGLGSGNPCTVPLPPCATDMIGPSNGPPDGTTNVLDLLYVINNYNATQTPPGTGPRPNGDCAPLPNGNCVTNVQDLLAVIGNYGPCPVEQRACCFTNGSCQFIGSAACATAGGTWGAAGSNCSPNLCVAAPANDNCQGRIVVTNGTHSINNTGATTSPQPGGSCAFGGAANFTRDIWYTYTANCTGNLVIDLCSTTGAVTDTVVAVYTGTCPDGLTEVACDDDGCGVFTTGSLLSNLVMSATSGTTYYIRIGSWATSPAGPMTMTISCTPFNNDNCSEATTMTLGVPVTGQNLGDATAADAVPSCPPVAPGAKGRWYTITSATDRTLTVDTCGSPNPTRGEEWDHQISVFCGSGCGASTLFCVASIGNGDSCGVFAESLSWCAKAGQKYWILVSTPDNFTNMIFNVVVNGGATCGTFAACGLANDSCQGAIMVASPSTTNGDNTTASPAGTGPDSEFPAGSPTCHWNGTPTSVFATVWYKFVATSTYAKADLCTSPAHTSHDPIIAMYSGSCGSLVEVGCDDDTCSPAGQPYTSSMEVTTLSVGQTYYIMVGATGAWAGSVPGTFTLVLTRTPPPPPSCPPTIPTTGCTAQIAGNGPFDGVNGTRPSAGWQGGALGVMEDMVLCNVGGCTVNQVKVHFIDQVTAGTGTLSTYNVIRLSIYNLAGGPISALAPCTATPLYTNDFTVGTNCTKAIVGAAFSSDIELWTMTVTPAQHFAMGNYGVYFSFPQLNAASASNTTFIATGPTGGTPATAGNNSSPSNVFIWGNSTPTAACTAVNATTAQHSAWCAGGTVP